MANRFTVTIGGATYTSDIPYSLKWNGELNDTLDDALIELKQIPVAQFEPFTLALVSTIDKFNNTKQYRWVVQSDEAVETPVGSGKYNHTLRLIEETKILENYPIDSLTFTNALGRSYTAGATKVNIQKLRGNGTYTDNASLAMFSPMLEGNGTFASLKDFFYPTFTNGVDGGEIEITRDSQIIVDPNNSNNLIVSGGTQVYYLDAYPQLSDPETYDLIDVRPQVSLEAGTYTVAYYTANPGYWDIAYAFQIMVAEDEQPLQRWAVTGMVNRILEVAEPLRFGQTPRFRLNDSQAAEFAKSEAPEMTFTKCHLREALNEVGKIVHGIPRLDDGVIYFEMLGGTHMSDLSTKAYITKIVTSNCEDYLTGLDSNVENMVSMLDYAEGVISEPYYEGYKTVRTETVYARVQDDNMIISTEFPIYEVRNLIFAYTNEQPNGRVGDIVPYVFEKADYDRMSAYSTIYPTSKAYALYFAQGQQNIYGLNFKVPDVTGGVLSKYAIVNIFNAITGRNVNSLDYPTLAFQITYVAIVPARCGQVKSYIGDRSIKRTKIFNQSENMIESRYYGENLKGTVARLGNVEIVLTYNFDSLLDIPQYGDLFDDDYYISSVAVEMLSFFFKVTVTLSKNYNQVSQFIGLKNQRRYYEVSEKQVYKRDILYNDYIVFGDAIPNYSGNDTLLGSLGIGSVKDVFLQAENQKALSVVDIQGYTDNSGAVGTAQQRCMLPVISTSLGNSVLLTAQYKDNYSAGQQTTYQNNVGSNIVGYFVNDVKYTDYYGRLAYLAFSFRQKWTTPTNYSEQTTIGTKLPAVNGNVESTGWVSTFQPSELPLKLWKDSRERIAINYQLHFTANRANMIIGSGLARLNSMVRGSDSSLTGQMKIVLLNERLPKFNTLIDISDAVSTATVTSGMFSVPQTARQKFSYTATADCKAWAIVAPAKDADGNLISDYGEILIGENTAYKSGDSIEFIITPKHEVFN